MTEERSASDLAGLVATNTPLLVAVDFDGTLAHLVDNPDDARMTPQARSALLTLTDAPGVTIAIVSGRGAKNLTDVASPDPKWWLVGSHGMEVIPPGKTVNSGFDEAFVSQRDSLWSAFEGVARDYPGTWVEKKTFGAALHTRGVDDATEARAHAALRPVIESFDGDLTTRTGHGILESSLGALTKGDGITRVISHVTPGQAVFIGDDVTDEDGFRALREGDITIKVGQGDTLAAFRMSGPDEVGLFLHHLATARAT